MRQYLIQIPAGPRLTNAAAERAADPLTAAHLRWADMADLRFDVHPLLAAEIGPALHALARSPSASPRMRQSLTAVATRLQQDTPPVTVTLPRQVVLPLVAAMQMIYHAPAHHPRLRQLAHDEGHRLQDLVCDKPDLHRLVDAGWRLPQ